jgi:hypothetical protein
LNPLRISRREKGLKSPDEGLQNIPKTAKRHGLKPRREARRKSQKPRISSAKAGKAPRVKGLHINHDSTGAQVKEGAKEHIQASKLSNIITTSYNRVPTVVRSTS